MRSDVANIQLRQTGKVSYAQCALLSILLMIATKFCSLPAVLAGISGSKAVWSVLILSVIELAILFFSAKTAKCGGLLSLDLKRSIKIPILVFFTLFFALKLTAFTREISTYYALSLFENAPVLPIMILLLLSCSLVARKGFMAIGRLVEIFLWLFLFVFLFVVIFTRTEGDLFNALAMFSPDVDGIGKGVLSGMAWYGDGVILSFLDLRGEEGGSPHARQLDPPPLYAKAKRRIACAAALSSVLIVVIFYAVFTSVYGDAAKMTDYAFIKLSAFKANTDELGSADWPVIILWAILSSLYLSMILISGSTCLRELSAQEKDHAGPLSYFLLGGAAVIFATLFLEEERAYASFMTRVMNVPSIVAALLSLALGINALVRAKGKPHEDEN